MTTNLREYEKLKRTIKNLQDRKTSIFTILTQLNVLLECLEQDLGYMSVELHEANEAITLDGAGGKN